MLDPKKLKVGGRNGQGRVRKCVVPVVALLAGPGTAMVLWGLVVFIIDRDQYISTYERMEELPPVLGVGSFVGVAAFIVALVWVAWSPSERS